MNGNVAQENPGSQQPSWPAGALAQMLKSDQVYQVPFRPSQMPWSAHNDPGAFNADIEERDENSQASPDSLVNDLYRQYVVVGPEEIVTFLRRNRTLPALLMEIGRQLRISFGDIPTITVEVIRSEGESPTLRIAVLSEMTAEKANEALDHFDHTYWLANCTRASGNVVVDFELV